MTRIATWSSALAEREATTDPRLVRWLELLVATPGLTAVTALADAWALHVEDALVALPLIDAGPVVDVGSGGGSPGIPLASARPDLTVHLLESQQRKCVFLRKAAIEFDNVTVVHARAEDHGRAAGRDLYAVAVARALAPPAVAAEWCLPLVRPGGLAIIYAGATTASLDRVAADLGASGPESLPQPGSATRQLLVFRKVAPTPPRFPRRSGMARKRPLA